MTMQKPEERLPSLFIIPFVLIFVAFFLFIALLEGRRELTIFTILILSLMGGAKLWSKATLSGLRITPKIDRHKVFPGEKIVLELKAENPRFLPIWFQVVFSLSDPLHTASGEEILKKESGLLWYQRVRFSWELVPEKRGVYPLGPPHVKVGDLFGFFPAEKEAGDSLSVVVFPRLVPIEPFPIPKRDFFGVPGGKSPVQDPIYILGTRDYQGWQPAKYIHWKTSARHDRLQEKVFEPSVQEKVLIIVDVVQFQSKGAVEAFERTLEIVASLAVQLGRQGFAVGIATNGSIVGGGSNLLPIAANREQIPAVLELLARLNMEAQDNLLDILRGGLNMPWGVSCAWFCYEKDETALKAKEYFFHRRTPVVFYPFRLGSAEDGNGEGIDTTIDQPEDQLRIEGT
jgi:uncharacterized protein (DUF58 family)